MSPRSCRLALIVLCVAVEFAAPAVFAAAPTFGAFSPTSGKLGTTITIVGSNFVSGGTTVSINGVTSNTVTVLSSTKLSVVVSLVASTGALTIKTGGGTATAGVPFTVVPGLLASTYSGAPTSARTLYYAGFGTYEAVDVYFDAEDIALTTASAAGAGNLAITIPADAASGTHWLTIVGRHTGYSGQVSYVVRADYPAYGYSAYHQGDNLFENTRSRQCRHPARILAHA